MYPAQVWIQRRYKVRYKVVCPPFLNPRRRGSDRHMPPAANPNPDRARRAASFADIERWESDTDSEGSDQEVDFHEGSNLSQTQVLALCM